MGADTDAIETETFGEHHTTAKAMRVAYQLDVCKSDKDNIVLIMDYAQNLAERKGGKRANEVTSMLHHTLDLCGVLSAATADVVEKTESPGRVTVWADNCGGRNKNSQVVWYFMFLVEFGVLSEAHPKFFAKGHTKNACDRGFGIIKRHMRRKSCWTIPTLEEAVNRATESVSVVNLEEEKNPFWASKDFFASRYRKLVGIQQYHIFRFTRERPGYVGVQADPYVIWRLDQATQRKKPGA
ncbi:hypothetical protein ON010_g7055 [Phytophthora cinnamomi]|nr:hypothetical protein ON010_g7055 [Phytophthora cinnamomi]